MIRATSTMTDMWQTTSWPAGSATRACTTCKRRKRQCDKQMPMCSSCKWLVTTCQYELPSSSATTMRGAAAVQNISAALPWVRVELDSIVSTIRDYATTLFGSVQRLDAMLLEYFSRIQPWLPFISRQRFYDRLARFSNTSNYSFVLLTCVMDLILSIPPQIEIGSARSTKYIQIKRLIALAESQDQPGIDLVQCRLLVALYEINHGATDEAYLSIGMCSRAGIILGLDHMQRRTDDSRHLLSLPLEEERRTWWTITILDRILRLQRPTWPTAVKDPSSSDLLPMDDAEWDRLPNSIPSPLSLHMSEHDYSRGDAKAPLLVSTSSHVRVGYFARLAQISHLLGLVLNNQFNPTPDCAFNAEETQQLRRTLAVYAELLPKEASAADCSHYCGPIAICLTAQLILEQSSVENLPEGEANCDFNLATERLSAAMVAMVEDMNVELAVTGFHLLRPLALRAIYHVSQIYVRQCQRNPDPKYKHGIRVLLQSLIFFQQRWRLAGVYRAKILAEIELLSISI